MSDTKYPRPIWSVDWSGAVTIQPAKRDEWVRQMVAEIRAGKSEGGCCSSGNARVYVKLDKDDGAIAIYDTTPVRSGLLYPEETLNDDMTVTVPQGEHQP